MTLLLSCTQGDCLRILESGAAPALTPFILSHLSDSSCTVERESTFHAVVKFLASHPARLDSETTSLCARALRWIPDAFDEPLDSLCVACLRTVPHGEAYALLFAMADRYESALADTLLRMNGYRFLLPHVRSSNPAAVQILDVLARIGGSAHVDEMALEGARSGLTAAVLEDVQRNPMVPPWMVPLLDTLLPTDQDGAQRYWGVLASDAHDEVLRRIAIDRLTPVRPASPLGFDQSPA